MSKAILSEGYGIMPNVILFDPEVSSTGKLVMCHLMSLAAATGSCRPRNKYLADKFSISTRQVTRALEELASYIHCSEDEQGRRVIELAPEFTDEGGGRQKSLGGTTKSSIHSNINSNKNKYMSEVEKVYKVWLIFMVVDPDIRLTGSTELKQSALEAAKKRTKLTDTRKTQIAARLADCDGDADFLCKAIKNLSESSWHMGENDKGWKADMNFLFRNYEQVEKWANR